MTIFLLAILAFLALSSLFIAIIMLTQVAESSPQTRIRKRITILKSSPTGTNSQLLKGSLYSEIPSFNRFLSDIPTTKKLDLLLDRANLNIGVGLFILLSFSTAVVAFSILVTIFKQPTGLSLLGAALTALGPYAYVKYLARRRM